MILLIILAYFVIACFVTVCAEKIFELEEFTGDEDNIAQYLIGMSWIISIPIILCTYGFYHLGKFFCKKFRKLLNVNYPC